MTRPAMAIVGATAEADGVRVCTTAAQFLFRADGSIDARCTLPAERDVARFVLDGDDDARTAPWQLVSCDRESAVLSHGAGSATVRGDSVVILRSARPSQQPRPSRITAVPAFRPEYLETHRGRTLALDDAGGFGIYPVDPRPGSRVPPRAASTPGETWLAVFPTRGPDPAMESARLAHEGRPQTWRHGLDAAYPSRDVLADAARTCSILAVHAYVWRAAPLVARLRPGRHFLRRCEWRTPRHEPADPSRFRRLLDDARALGLRVLLYISPRHSAAPDIFAEMSRILDEHAPDGLYLDETADDLPTLDATVRRAREILGPDRILYLNAAAEPFGTPRVWAPFVDAQCDIVLRGSEGRAGLALPTFLRYAVSGRNTSGAAGHWCHYGGRLIERAPTDAEIRAVRAAGAHLWRRSRWGAAALARIDGLDSGAR